MAQTTQAATTTTATTTAIATTTTSPITPRISNGNGGAETSTGNGVGGSSEDPFNKNIVVPLSDMPRPRKQGSHSTSSRFNGRGTLTKLERMPPIKRKTRTPTLLLLTSSTIIRSSYPFFLFIYQSHIISCQSLLSV
jgi:hypothetical protein